MSKVRYEKRAAGAFGAVREHDVYEDEHEERDHFRLHVVEAVSSTWSYSEIRDFGEQQERDRERAREIAEIFDGLQGESLEEICYVAYQRRLGVSREDQRLNHAARLLKRRRYKARFDSDPEFRESERAKAKARYLRWRANHPRPKKEKLSAEIATEIRVLYATGTGLFQVDLARLYGVTISTVGLIVKGKIWKTADGPVVERALRTHRRIPLVKCADKVEAQLEKRRARKRRKYAEDPDYFKRYEHERRQRDPEAQRAKDRAAYRRKADKAKDKYREIGDRA